MLGARLLVRYAGAAENLWHERVVLGHLGGARYLISTPDGDVYEEDYSPNNPDIDAVRIQTNNEVPADLRNENLHRFAVYPTAAELRRYREEAGLLAGLRGGGAPAAPGGGPGRRRREAAPAEGPSGTLGRWRAAEHSVSGRFIGELVPADVVPDVVPDSLKQLLEWDGEEVFCMWVAESDFEQWKQQKAPLDVRILKVQGSSSKRNRNWEAILADSSETHFADWPLKGPRTTGWVMDFLGQQPGGAKEHHALWRRATGLGVNDFGVAEHEVLLETLRLAATYDQYNVANSAAMEHVARRLQMIEYAHQERLRELGKGGGKAQSSGSLTMEEQDAFSGSKRLGTAMVSPALIEYVKEDVGKSAELMKSLMKAREFREQQVQKK